MKDAVSDRNPGSFRVRSPVEGSCRRVDHDAEAICISHISTKAVIRTRELKNIEDPSLDCSPATHFQIFLLGFLARRILGNLDELKSFTLGYSLTLATE